jgi:two-component system, NarL family, response regulator NreC
VEARPRSETTVRRRAGRRVSKQAGQRIRVFLLDDHAIVREGLRLVLRMYNDMEVVGEAGTLGEACHFMGRADVILADLLMPDVRGPKLVKTLRERHPQSRILILTMVDNPADVYLSLAAGAEGYVLKEVAASDLVDAIRRVAVGEGYLQPSLGAVVMRAAEAEHAGGRPFDPLSDRERDVLRLVALGYTNSEVGTLLGIAQRTVESHRTHILRKLGIRGRADLVRYAAETGIIRLSARSSL